MMNYLLEPNLCLSNYNFKLKNLQKETAPKLMGLTVSKATDLFFGPQLKFIIVGLDCAGKSTLLHNLKLGEVVSSVPSIGINLETVETKNIKFIAWDVGGSDRIEALWNPYYQDSHGIIFVVDSSDKDQISSAKYELDKILNRSQVKDTPLLVLATKKDIDSVMSVTEIVEELGLHLLRDKTWYIEAVSGITGEGLSEGINWLTRAATKNK